MDLNDYHLIPWSCQLSFTSAFSPTTLLSQKTSSYSQTQSHRSAWQLLLAFRTTYALLWHQTLCSPCVSSPRFRSNTSSSLYHVINTYSLNSGPTVCQPPSSTDPTAWSSLWKTLSSAAKLPVRSCLNQAVATAPKLSIPILALHSHHLTSYFSLSSSLCSFPSRG